jgi:uncharacterized FlgJ-related protein
MAKLDKDYLLPETRKELERLTNELDLLIKHISPAHRITLPTSGELFKIVSWAQGKVKVLTGVLKPPKPEKVPAELQAIEPIVLSEAEEESGWYLSKKGNPTNTLFGFRVSIYRCKDSPKNYSGACYVTQDHTIYVNNVRSRKQIINELHDIAEKNQPQQLEIINVR